MQGLAANLVTTLKQFELHPYIDHFTIALLVVAVLTDLVASLFSSRLWLRYMALTLIILGAVCAAGSEVTGQWDAKRVFHQLLPAAKQLLHQHAELGEVLPWVFGALALWRVGVQFIGFISASRPLYLLAALIAGGVVIYQAYLGGKLVFSFGVGTAVMPSASPSPAAPAPATSPTAAPAIPAKPTPLPTVFVPTPSPGASPSAAESPSPAAAASPSAKLSPSPGASTTATPSASAS